MILTLDLGCAKQPLFFCLYQHGELVKYSVAKLSFATGELTKILLAEMMVDVKRFNEFLNPKDYLSYFNKNIAHDFTFSLLSTGIIYLTFKTN